MKILLKSIPIIALFVSFTYYVLKTRPLLNTTLIGVVASREKLINIAKVGQPPFYKQGGFYLESLSSWYPELTETRDLK